LKQSVAILEYLEEAEAFKETTKLLPEDPVERAQVREVVEIVNSFIQPLQNKLIVEEVAKLDPEFAESLKQAVNAHAGEKVRKEEGEPDFWPQRFIHRGFTALERILEKQPGPYCFGSKPTLADCVLIPQVIGAKKYKVNLSLYPRICGIYKEVTSLETVKEGLAEVLSTVE
jgi:maleylacetoacetate isomerase